MLLRPQIAAPTHIARLTALGLAFAGAGLFAIAKPALESPAPHASPTILVPTVDPPALEIEVPAVSQIEAPPLAPASTRSVAMVFQAQGATWMKLAALPDGAAVPPHGPVRHTAEGYLQVATAELPLAEVPEIHRERLGDKIVVDGTCTTYITGFALVARLTGDTSYAGDEAGADWTADSVMRLGAPMLAAKLGDCTGTLARDGALPPAITMHTAPPSGRDAPLVARARTMLLESADAKATTREWNEHYTGQPAPTPWTRDEATQWQTLVFEHPTTHETWISIHAHQMEACGAPRVNVWGLYRVEKDGTLTAFPASLGEIGTIEQLVDLDGDGVVEVVGEAWLGTRYVNDAKGATLEQLDEMFYGCPC